MHWHDIMLTYHNFLESWIRLIHTMLSWFKFILITCRGGVPRGAHHVLHRPKCGRDLNGCSNDGWVPNTINMSNANTRASRSTSLLPSSLTSISQLANWWHVQSCSYILFVGLCLQLRNSLLRRFSALAGHRQSCAMATLHPIHWNMTHPLTLSGEYVWLDKARPCRCAWPTRPEVRLAVSAFRCCQCLFVFVLVMLPYKAMWNEFLLLFQFAHVLLDGLIHFWRQRKSHVSFWTWDSQGFQQSMTQQRLTDAKDWCRVMHQIHHKLLVLSAVIEAELEKDPS